MLRRLSRVISSDGESSEDDVRHPKKQVKMPVSRIQVGQFSENQSGSNASVNEVKSHSNSPAPYLTRLRTRDTVSNSDTSNQSGTSGTDDSLHNNYNYTNSIRARVISSDSESSEDDGRHPKKQVRMPVSRIQVEQFSENQSGSNASVNEFKSHSNNPTPYLTRLRTRDTLSNSGTSNQSGTSGTDDSLQNNYNYTNRIRAMSSQDSGTSNDTNDICPNIVNTKNLPTNNAHNNVTSEYSSDNSSIFQTRSIKRRNTSIVNLVSSSETSDSGMPSGPERATKRSRLFSSSDSNSSSIFTSSSNHSNEYGEISPHTTIGNEIASNGNARSNEIASNGSARLQRDLRRRTLRSSDTNPNPLRTQTRARISSSRQNRIGASSENNLPRSTVQTNHFPERGVRSNTVQRNTRSSASTSAASQNPQQNGNRQNNRRLEMVQITTSTFPAHRPNVRISLNNSPNLSNESIPSTHGRIPYPDQQNTRRTRQITFRSPINLARTPSANQQNNTRPLVNRQSDDAPQFVSERQGRNRETVGRATTNPNPVTAPRRNIASTEPPVASNQDRGLNLRLSIRNGRNSRVSRNLSSDLLADSDSDSSSGSSIDEVVRVRKRRRVIFSSDNTSSSDSDASSIVNRARRSVHVVISDSDLEENIRDKVVKNSEKTHQGIQSDSDGETEKCTICFGKFTEQEVGTPQSCKHFFCLVCIKKWAENSNTCPVDRRTFYSIIVRSNVHGGVIREEVVPPPNMASQSDDESFLGNFSDSDSNSESLMFFSGTFESDWFDSDALDDIIENNLI